MLPAIILFAATYVLMLTFSKFRPYIALTSGVIFILTGMLPKEQIISALDFNVILMIGGNTNGPEFRNLQRNVSWYEFAQKAKAVAALNSVPVIDCAGESGFGYARVKARKYQKDNIHLNDLGGVNMANFIWSKLQFIPPWIAE